MDCQMESSIIVENAPNSKKLKKRARKNLSRSKEKADTKKPRQPVQQNRFTNILELSTLSASLMQLHDLFGTLVLDFSEDPVQLKISDVTGNYELNIPKESLSEFKMKVLLGQTSKGKPAISIYLGDCQCYPELPEGALELNESQNDKTGSQIDSIDDEGKTGANIDAVELNDNHNNKTGSHIDSIDDEGVTGANSVAEELNDNQNDKTGCQVDLIDDESKTGSKFHAAVGCDEVERDTVNSPSADTGDDGVFESVEMVAPLFALFEGNQAGAAGATSRKNLVTYETRHISISESQNMGPLNDSDELTVKMRPRRVSTQLKKNRSSKQPEGFTAARRASKTRSTYRSNLEGFVKFLMTDTVCGSLLEKLKAPVDVAQAAKLITEQEVVNYSGCQEYHAFFSKVKASGKGVKPEGSAVSNGLSNSEETDHCLRTDTVSAGGNGVQVLFERPKPFEKAAFVEQVKKELEEWQARGQQTVNVEIIEDAKSSSSVEDSDSNVVTVYEDPKTSKKLDTEFDDTSSYCFSEAAVETAQTFLLDLKEQEKPENTEEKNVPLTDGGNELDLLKSVTFDRTYRKEKSAEYVAPLPLDTTTTADIEAMWMNFVKMFHQSSELAKKLSVSETVDPVISPERLSVEVARGMDHHRQLPDCSYPGQHYLPYFVEESIKEVNSKMETWRSPNYFSTAIKKPQDAICPPQMSNLSLFEGDLTSGNKTLSPKNFDVQSGPPFHRHPPLPKKFSIKKSRIFFNPHVSIGDWC